MFTKIVILNDLNCQIKLSTYFTDVGAPNQRALNEQTNGSLRKDGLGGCLFPFIGSEVTSRSLERLKIR